MNGPHDFCPPVRVVCQNTGWTGKPSGEKRSTIKEALLSADKAIASVGGERRRLNCHEIGGCFYCDAEILNPKTEEDRKYPIMDLWRSESAKAARFLAKFAMMGGWGQGEDRVEAVANGCVLRVPVSMVQEVRAHEQERAKRELERNDGD